MTRLYNDPVDFKEELIAGFVSAYSRYVKRVPNVSGVMALDAPQPTNSESKPNSYNWLSGVTVSNVRC